jgi:DNA-binding XRE family transcriptional regulator
MTGTQTRMKISYLMKWEGSGSDAELARYEPLLTRRLEQAFAGAEVTVEVIRGGGMSIAWIGGVDAATEAAVEEEVLRIERAFRADIEAGRGGSEPAPTVQTLRAAGSGAGCACTGEDLAARRTALGFSQGTLARHLGVARTTIVRWEAGTLAIKSPHMLDLALEALEARAHRAG